jgi:hypothetical protein
MALYSSSFLRCTESTADVFYSDGKGHCFCSEAQGWGRLQARVGMRPVRCPSYWHFMRSTSESRPRPWLKNEPTEPTTRFGVHAPRKQPATGNDLRRTYKTIAGTCRIPDDVSAYLMGHVPEAMSQKYLLRWALSSADAVKEAQARISATIMQLLHAAERKRAA